MNELHSCLEVVISGELSAVVLNFTHAYSSCETTGHNVLCESDERNPELLRDSTAVPSLRRSLRHVALMLIIVINQIDQIMQQFEIRPVGCIRMRVFWPVFLASGAAPRSSFRVWRGKHRVVECVGEASEQKTHNLIHPSETVLF
jgi:hypothetical protein